MSQVRVTPCTASIDLASLCQCDIYPISNANLIDARLADGLAIHGDNPSELIVETWLSSCDPVSTPFFPGVSQRVREAGGGAQHGAAAGAQGPGRGEGAEGRSWRVRLYGWVGGGWWVISTKLHCAAVLGVGAGGGWQGVGLEGCFGWFWTMPFRCLTKRCCYFC
jgi:hypothetical protein